MSVERLAWTPGAQDDLLEIARSAGVLSALDHQFAHRLAALYGESSDSVRWALAIASRQEAAGHVCADLHRLAEQGLLAEGGDETRTYSALATSSSVAEWIEELGASALVEGGRADAAGPHDGSPRPLVIDEQGRLYLRRAFRAEARLAELVLERAARADFEIDWERAEQGIERMLADSDSDSDSDSDTDSEDAPRRALRAGLARPLSIVTGGPGTGKTTLVERLCALLIDEAESRGCAPPRIRLLAPTGKAAAAMTNSFARQREALAAEPAVRAALPAAAETIHRVLYRQTRRDAFGRPRPFALDADVVVIDEASMVDLDLMARVFAACASVGRVVLLGDPGQLASVDSGAVLAELCEGRATGAPPRPLANSVVTLRTSHRFADGGGIGRLASAIREGDADAAIALLEDPDQPEVERCPADSIEVVRARLVDESRRVHREIEAAAEPFAKLDRLSLYRVLCAHRRGPLGVETLCSVLDDAAASARQTSSRSGWWLGRMLLVTRNAPEQDLWNGDVGLIEETESGLRALFSDGAGGVRALSAGRLPAHESAIAMSVHKSQGSEFAVVDFVLGDFTSRLMTRELLYTGVTRARERLRIHASESVIREAIARRVQRDSGLGERLEAG